MTGIDIFWTAAGLVRIGICHWGLWLRWPRCVREFNRTASLSLTTKNWRKYLYREGYNMKRNCDLYYFVGVETLTKIRYAACVARIGEARNLVRKPLLKQFVCRSRGDGRRWCWRCWTFGCNSEDKCLHITAVRISNRSGFVSKDSFL
jgi:hypothetical protein